MDSLTHEVLDVESYMQTDTDTFRLNYIEVAMMQLCGLPRI